jgi:hypothetical protein
VNETIVRLPLAERRAELEAMSDAELLRVLYKNNPFGGYSIGARKGQMRREWAIDTILRYAGYKL